MDTSAEGLDAMGQPGEFLAVTDLRLQLPLLLGESLGAAVHVLPTAAILLQRYDTSEIGLSEALQLVGETPLSAPEPFTAGVKFLWHPIHPTGTFKSLGDGGGIGEQRTRICPDEIIELERRAQTGGTLLLTMGGQRLGSGS
jgi:hypothetical protein